jgi:hypothetical protein
MVEPSAGRVAYVVVNAAAAAAPLEASAAAAAQNMTRQGVRTQNNIQMFCFANIVWALG